jgi:nitrogen regulatory protein PII
MATVVPMQKVEIVIEALELPRVLAAVERAGASGYTVVPHVTGKGRRGAREDGDLTDIFRSVLVVVVGSAAVITRIVEAVVPLLSTFAGILIVSEVRALAGHPPEGS